MGSATSDSFAQRPAWVKPGNEFPPAFSVIETSDYVNFRSIFTSQLFGVNPFLVAPSVNYDAMTDGRIVFGMAEVPDDGSCVTDTLWGIGEVGQPVGWFVVLNKETTTTVQARGSDAAVAEDLVCYPNPTEGDFTIASNILHSVRIEVYDLLGRAIYEASEVSLPLQVPTSGHHGPLFVYATDPLTQIRYSTIVVVDQ